MFVDSSECGRGTIKGGRTSPTVLPGKKQPQAPPTRVAAVVGNSQQHRTAEGLAILVQHLVFNVGAFEVPTLRRQVETYRRKAEEIQLAFQCLEKSLAEQKICYQQSIEDERFRHQNEIANLTEKHRNEVEKLGSEHAKLEQCLLAEKEKSRQNLCKQHEEELSNLKNEFIKLQRTHEESLQILREENDDIREQIDEKRSELEKARHESQKLKEDYENKEGVLNTHIQKHRQQINNLQNQYEEKFAKLIEESSRLREENDRLLGYGDDKGIGLQEVQSLRVVLELKQNEVTELRKALEKAIQKAELLEGAEEKARVLNARCEDLQLQLERKSDFEKSLVSENQKLQESFREETNQTRRLIRYSEELRWKLEQNKEVVAKVFEQAEEGIFNRTILSSSFNERHLTKSNLDRTLSFKDRIPSRSSYSVEDSGKSKNIEDLSPPTSPIVKGVVEKSDSVSYVLDLDESPEVIASRIVRRSFRNTTPPKNTPTKSPSNKRPRIRIGLSQSASSSAIISPRKNEVERSHSSNRNNDSESDDAMTNLPKYEGNSDSCESSNFSMKLDDNLDLDEDEIDIALPALPSELNKTNRVQALPTPKHLAGDNMISDSNSEDESTSSSHL